jgi:hypothetical protein
MGREGSARHEGMEAHKHEEEESASADAAMKERAATKRRSDEATKGRSRLAATQR